jgi:hypothetical protein
MKKSELKQVLKPLIKECIKEVIFEDGVLSGLITEVAQGLSGIQPPQINNTQRQPIQTSKSETVLEARKQLSEVKSQLQNATGLKGIFEGTTPIPQKKGSKNSQYGSLRDKDPNDAGVNIDSLVKMTGGWTI